MAQSSKMAAWRKFAVERLGGKCEKCSEDDVDNLVIHHIDGNPKNQEVDNLQVLCYTHHREIHPNTPTKERAENHKSKIKTIIVRTKGRIVIPKEFCILLGLEEDTVIKCWINDSGNLEMTKP